MGYETVILEKADAYGVITLNRPPFNPISRQLLIDLGAAVDELVADAAMRSIIITGSGEKAFCAGADLKDGFGGNPADLIKLGQGTFMKIERCGKPVIAAINGVALGGGCEMAMSCTWRLIGENVKMIGLPESNLGIIPGYGGTQRMPRLVGKPKALELMILGKSSSAAEAVEIGLCDKLCAAGTVLDEAKALAGLIAARAPQATCQILDAVNRGTETDIVAAMDIECDCFCEVVKTADAAEGIKAFLEKRKAEFKGV
jgi:enoyl-CoA hydratase